MFPKLSIDQCAILNAANMRVAWEPRICGALALSWRLALKLDAAHANSTKKEEQHDDSDDQRIFILQEHSLTRLAHSSVCMTISASPFREDQAEKTYLKANLKYNLKGDEEPGV